MARFPFDMTDPPTFNTSVPDAVDVVVIGGGIIGVMTAWFLVQRGYSVFVAEKGKVAAEQSSRNWGWIRQQGRDPAELPIMMEANRIWQGLETECGETFGFRQSGIAYLARSDNEMAPLLKWMEHARAHDLDTRVIGRDEIAALMPGTASVWLGGIYTASDARAEPWIAVPTIARRAHQLGANICEGCAVRGLDIAAGRVAGVVTERGRIRCQHVVLAGGAWSALFARHHDINLPQLSVVSSVATTEPLASHCEGAISESGFAMRRRADGGFTIAPGGYHELYIGPHAVRNFPRFLPQLRNDPFGTRFRPASPRGFPDAWMMPRRWSEESASPFEANRILNPDPNRHAIERALTRFAQALPTLGRPKLRLAWAGMIDTMPDVVPVIDRVQAIPGLIIATGMSGHGFGIGPAVGRIVADIIAERDPGHDLTRFRLARFSDGSPIELGPSL